MQTSEMPTFPVERSGEPPGQSWCRRMGAAWSWMVDSCCANDPAVVSGSAIICLKDRVTSKHHT
jgi:hypothetical protein